MTIDTEVVILGTGPAGCATALALLQKGVERLVVLHRPRRQAFVIGESATPDVVDRLRQLGLDADLRLQGHAPYYVNLSRWAGRLDADDFLHRAVDHGWHLDRARFDEELRRQTKQRGARLFPVDRLKGIDQQREQWRLTIDHNGLEQELSCRYLVDASGRGAILSRRFGIGQQRLDNLVALACKVDQGHKLKGRTLVESMPDGWWYAAYLPSGEALVTLMSDADLIRSHGWRESERFIAQWRQTEELIRWVPAPENDPIRVNSFAAHSAFLRQAAGPGWIAVGDALAAFDPLTSSGITNALGDGIEASEVILDWLKRDSLQGAEYYAHRTNASVKRYLEERYRHYAAEKRWAKQVFWARRNTIDLTRIYGL